MEFIYTSLSKTVSIFILTTALVMYSCNDYELSPEITESGEVPGLSFFAFPAINNKALYQDIVFAKREDNSYEAKVGYSPDRRLSQIFT